MIKLDVGSAPAELRAAVLAMKAATKNIRAQISSDLRGTMGPVWKQEVNEHLTGTGRMEARMLTPGVRIAAGNPPSLVAASSRRKAGRGLVPDKNWPGYEYGASDRTAAMKSRKGKAYDRHVMRHLPARSRRGRVLEPAVAAFLPRVASFWAQSIIRAFMDAAEGKS